MDDAETSCKQLFRGGLSRAAPDGILSHFGSMEAAVHRIDSMFASQHPHMMTPDGTLIALDREFFPLRIEAPENVVAGFAAFAEGASVSAFKVRTGKELRLYDCWGDDPVGSGSMGLFVRNKDITPAQRGELRALFAPFSNVIYPDDVRRLVPRAALKRMREEGEKSEIFNREMAKRKRRSKSIGEDFTAALPQEIVWTTMTLRLRRWALASQYGSFAYTNTSEGGGQDSYITLRKDSIAETGPAYTFDKGKFLETVTPVFADFLKASTKKTREEEAQSVAVQGMVWAGMDPLQFWKRAA